MVSKTTRFEVELQNNPQLDETGLRKLMAQRGHNAIAEAHDQHKEFQNNLTEALNKLKVDFKIVNRYVVHVFVIIQVYSVF